MKRLNIISYNFFILKMNFTRVPEKWPTRASSIASPPLTSSLISPVWSVHFVFRARASAFYSVGVPKDLDAFQRHVKFTVSGRAGKMGQSVASCNAVAAELLARSRVHICPRKTRGKRRLFQIVRCTRSRFCFPPAFFNSFDARLLTAFSCEPSHSAVFQLTFS